MYQYSLYWYQNLFKLGVENSPASNDIGERLKKLNDYFTLSLYENVCNSLFERHKLLFSFLLTVKIKIGDGEIDNKQWHFLLSGYGKTLDIPENPTDWIDNNEWGVIYRNLYGL